MSYSPSQPIFLGRQPILDAQQATIGYELLFRAHSYDDSADFDSPVGATAQVVCSAFTELRIAEALRNMKAFIHVDQRFLEADAIELLPAEQVVLELSGDIGGEALDRCRELRARDYAFSVSVAPHSPAAAPELLELASYVKIGVADTPAEQIVAAVGQLKPHARKLLAAKIETAEQAAWCAKQGFRYFQGFFFARPVIEEGRKLEPTTQGLIRLINLVSSDAETTDIERGFKADPALTMNLLRVVNSAALGLRTTVRSIAQAVAVLGRRQLSRWLQLLLFRGSGGSLATNPLMMHAAMRGRLMELLMERRYPQERALFECAFIVGVMSLMPAALKMPMKEVLEQIALTDEVRDAVGNYEGKLGRLLLLIEYYDDNNALGCELTMQKIGELNQHMLNTCLAEVLAWIQSLEA